MRNVLLLFAICASSALACNQSIPSGDSCIYGKAFGAGNGGGPVHQCADWDTSCSSPYQTINEFHGTGGSYTDFEFLVPDGAQYRVMIDNNWAYYWDYPGPAGGVSVLTPTMGDQQTYEVDFYSYCTQQGISLCAYGCC
jgi:hypothetical protein